MTNPIDSPKSGIGAGGEKPTRRAQMACAEWLAACLKAGWGKDSLDGLESLWWEHHDRTGNLTGARDVAEAAGQDTERMEDALRQIKTWAEAYPPDVFHIPTSDEWKRLNEAAKAAGLGGIDAFSAASMRHVITKVQEIVDGALTGDAPSEPTEGMK